jgi:hypothetical protein
MKKGQIQNYQKEYFQHSQCLGMPFEDFKKDGRNLKRTKKKRKK